MCQVALSHQQRTKHVPEHNVISWTDMVPGAISLVAMNARRV